MKYLSIAILLMASVAGGGEPKVVKLAGIDATNGIQVVKPGAQLEPDKLYKLPITGISDDEFLNVSASVEPSRGVTLEIGMSPKRELYLWFEAEFAGQYPVAIVVNRGHLKWKNNLNLALQGASDAEPSVDAGLLAELQALADKAMVIHPTRSGTTVLEVVGPRPPPPIIPIPPPPQPAAGIVYAIIIRTTDTLTADAAKILSDLRQWTDQEPRVTHLEFPPDAVGPGGERDPNVATWVARIPPTAKQPFLFIAQKGVTGKMVVHWQGELPATAAEIIAKMKEHIR